MESFVRSLVEGRPSATGALANVIDEVIGGITDPVESLQSQPGFVDGLVRKALLREAVAALSHVGQIPLVLGEALWVSELTASPWERSLRSLGLLVAPGKLQQGIEALTARVFVLHRDTEADWFSLEGLPAVLCLRERLHDPISPFQLRLELVRKRATLDESSFGVAAWLPSAEDGLCAWAIEAGDALVHGRSPHWHDAAHWQARRPSELATLRASATDHGITRLLPTLLRAAHDVTGDAQLGRLARELGHSMWLELPARVCLRSFDGDGIERRLGALAVYALSPDVAALRQALSERALRIATRLISKT